MTLRPDVGGKGGEGGKGGKGGKASVEGEDGGLTTMTHHAFLPSAQPSRNSKSPTIL